MATDTIRRWGDPVLEQRAVEVDDIDGRVAALAGRMWEAMVAAEGLGVAAPQIGVGRRLFVYQLDEDAPPVTLINPTVVESRGEWECEEGCLSIPGLFFPIVRPKEVHVTGWDLQGRELSVEADEMEARCLQHEMDHLDGRLLVELLDGEQLAEARRHLRRLGGD